MKAEELENRVELAFCYSQHWGVQPTPGSCVLLDICFVEFFGFFFCVCFSACFTMEEITTIRKEGRELERNEE